MAIPVVVAAGIVQAGVAITQAIIGAVKAKQEAKKEAWNQVMSTPGMQERYMRGWEGVVNTTISRYNLQEEYLELQRAIEQTDQYIESQLIPIDISSYGSAINIGGEGQLEALQLELSQLIAERDGYQSKINNAIGIAGKYDAYNEYNPKIEALKPRIAALREEIANLESTLISTNEGLEGELAAAETELSQLIAERDGYQSKIDNAIGIAGRYHAYNEYTPKIEALNPKIAALREEIANLELEIAEQIEEREKAPPPDEVPDDTPGEPEQFIISRVENGEEKFYRLKTPTRGNRELIMAGVSGILLGGSFAYISEKLQKS